MHIVDTPEDWTRRMCRCCTSLFWTHYDEVVAYLKRKDAKAIGLGRLVRGIKKEAAWRHAFMHPENTFVHSSRSMPRCYSDLGLLVMFG